MNRWKQFKKTSTQKSSSIFVEDELWFFQNQAEAHKHFKPNLNPFMGDWLWNCVAFKAAYSYSFNLPQDSNPTVSSVKGLIDYLNVSHKNVPNSFSIILP